MENIQKYIEDFVPPVTHHSYKGTQFDAIRFDLFQPLDPKKYVGGLKSLQCCNLLMNNLEKIKSVNGGIVTTCSDLNSPQSNVVAGAASIFGLKCIVGVCGEESKTQAIIDKHKMVKSAIPFQAQIQPVSRAAYQSVIESRLSKWCKENNLNPFFIKFGINIDQDRDAIINSSARHMHLIPDDLDVLVVPVGSGLALGGVFTGLYLHKKRPKKIIGIQVSGSNRQSKINGYMPSFVKFRWQYAHVNRKYDIQYKEYVNFTTDDGQDFDCNYEGKAFSYFFNNPDEFGVDLSKDKIMVVSVGNTNPVRKAIGLIKYVDFNSRKIINNPN